MNNKLKEFYESIKGKHVTVLGLGVSNLPLIKMLTKKGAIVTGCDKKANPELEDAYKAFLNMGVKLKLGESYLDNIDADIIFKTPGIRIDIPELVEAKNKGAVITSEMEVFFELCPCKIIAVTGSDGKSTTTTLISEFLKAEGYNVFLGGNIGKPLLPEIESITPESIAVVELSSFQLHTMKKSPDIAVITNITPNHLDMHKSMEEYIDAKANIFKYQNEDNILVLNYDNEITRSFGVKAKSKVRYFSSHTKLIDGLYYNNDIILNANKNNSEILLKRDEIKLPGDHNVENIMAAILAVKDLVNMKAIKKVAATFSGIEHRIEFVREIDGIKFYNDSIASSPTRTIACFKSFLQKIILIAGGYDKKIPFDELGEKINEHVKCLILTGDTAEKIYNSVVNAPNYKEGRLPIIKCENLCTAVQLAKNNAEKGDIVVFSPACASFDRFKNFEERGKFFKNAVNSL